MHLVLLPTIISEHSNALYECTSVLSSTHAGNSKGARPCRRLSLKILHKYIRTSTRSQDVLGRFLLKDAIEEFNCTNSDEVKMEKLWTERILNTALHLVDFCNKNKLVF